MSGLIQRVVLHTVTLAALVLLPVLVWAVCR